MTKYSRIGRLFAGLALLAAAAFLTPDSGVAQEISESHLNAAREAVTVSRSTAQLDVILPNLGERVKQQLISNRPDAADQISTIVDEITVSLASRRGDLEEEVARIYARNFTEEELKVIAAFYNTEAGRKLIRETPVLARSMDQAARVWTQGIRRDLSAAVSEKIEAAGLN